MSSKLLAEFDVYYQASSEVPKLSSSTSLPGPNAQSVFDDLACLNKQSAEQPNKSAGKARDEPLSWFEDDGNSQTLQLSSDGQLKTGSGAITPKPYHGTAEDESNSDVLFDALEELGKVGDEDEFGDFESGDLVTPPNASNSSTTPTKDASSLHDVAQRFQGRKHDSATSSHAEPPSLLLLQERNPFEELLISTEHEAQSTEVEKAATPTTAWPSYVAPETQASQNSSTDRDLLDDGWGDFIDPGETASTAKATSRQSRNEMIGSSEIRQSKRLPSALTAKPLPFIAGNPSALPNISTDAMKPLSISKLTNPSAKPNISPIPNTDTPASSNSPTPPPNIPPPSILLPLLTTMLHHQYSTLNPSTRDQTQTPTTTSIPTLLTTAHVAAHILAGRKLRWKRDTLLSQSTKIGPAHSGKAGGMKLTGIDKAENLKEEREVADLVRVWKDHLGRVRSAVAAAGGKASGAGTSMLIPALAENMVVRTARVSEGAVTATKVCALCGLKREERVEKVDERVEDSFGEWWVEYWGHAMCKRFWDQYHNWLQQR